MKNSERKILNTREVSETYGTSIGMLAQWRFLKKGPRYYRVPNSRKVIYRVEDLDNFFLGNPVLTGDSANDRERA